jgi:DNA polymerase-3 subunit gamma/tau
MSQAFYRKWRPRRWEAVVGQEHVIQTLRNSVSAERVAHAYLFAGPRGTGKTTTARLLAKAANCLDPDPSVRPCDQCDHCQAINAGRFLDLIEIDAASNTSVDDVRDLRDKINFSPNQGRYKVYVVDEIHMLSTAAFNALLKTLEEPPSHAIFILATTEVHKIPATVLSRCQRHEFRRIPNATIIQHLKEMSAGENLEVEPEALALIARQATGSLRDAISLLDQLASTGQAISLELAQSVLGTAASQAVLEMIDALIARETSAGMDRLHRALDSGSDPRQFARQIVDYLRGLLLIQMGNADQIDASAEARAQMARHAQGFSTPDLLRTIRAFNFAANDARGAWQPALPLEMAFVESLQPAPEPLAPSPPPGQASSTPQKARRQGGASPLTPPEAQAEPERESGGSGQEESHETHSLNQAWPQLLNLVRKQNPNTYGLLNSCKSRYLKGDLLVLGFASDVLKNQMAKPENLEMVQKALAQLFGKDIIIRCTISTASRNSIPAEVDNDGMVAAALRDLGGEIVDVQ